jgi:lipoate-protein ligase A
MTVNDFASLIQEHIAEKYPDARIIELSQEDHEKIDELVRTKYNTWEWNFGYSPNYNFRKILRTEKSGTIEFDLDVRNGSIMMIRIFGDYFGKLDTEELEQLLTGSTHEEEAIRAKLNGIVMGDYITNLDMETFISGLF